MSFCYYYFFILSEKAKDELIYIWFVEQAHMSSLQSQWSWLVQLRWCLEAQIKHCTDHNTFFQEAQHCEQWMARHSELLQNRFSSDNIPIDHAQILLAELQVSEIGRGICLGFMDSYMYINNA